jgi:hypothetical protein
VDNVDKGNPSNKFINQEIKIIQSSIANKDVLTGRSIS